MCILCVKVYMKDVKKSIERGKINQAVYRV